MKAKYDVNPYYDLYMSLDKQIKYIATGYPNMDVFYKPIEGMALRILQNNGCRFVDNRANWLTKVETIIEDEVYIMYVKGGMGNDINEYFDIISLNGSYYVVIFIDYFANINISQPSNTKSEDPSDILAAEMGNSRYYDAIKKIVEISALLFVSPAINVSSMLSTAAAGCVKWNPAIIAIHILNSINPITENDIPDMDAKTMAEIAESNIVLQLYGIRL